MKIDRWNLIGNIKKIIDQKKKKQEDGDKPDENVADSEEKKQDQVIDHKVSENELKDNKEISKKLDKKIEKPRNF